MRVPLSMLLLAGLSAGQSFAADLSIDQIRKLPGVAEAVEAVPGERFIIHVRDWHWVPYRRFAEEPAKE